MTLDEVKEIFNPDLSYMRLGFSHEHRILSPFVASLWRHIEVPDLGCDRFRMLLMRLSRALLSGFQENRLEEWIEKEAKGNKWWDDLTYTVLPEEFDPEMVLHLFCDWWLS
jgi:hypothetical protein